MIHPFEKIEVNMQTTAALATVPLLFMGVKMACKGKKRK
jgi:hypothetical protein